MYMAYSKNPHLPRVRMQAVMLVRRGWSIRRAARHTGFSHGAIINWLKKAPSDGRLNIPTISSRPKTHPKSLSPEIVKRIAEVRLKHRRCAEVIHRELLNEGIRVSLSSVKRTLKRRMLLRTRSPWKKLHENVVRPEAVKAGDLVQIDTIHFLMPDGRRFYVYTLIDLVSRWAHARVSPKCNTHASLKFVRTAIKKAPFEFRMLQSDNGAEFSKWFTKRIGLSHRHSRVRQSNDNAHVERFNRTLQEEALTYTPRDPEACQRAIARYLPYYNNDRLHLGINLLTPQQVVRSY